MGAISFSTDFFQRDAAQHAPLNSRADRMDNAIVVRETKDVAIVRNALLIAVAWFAKPADKDPDAMESAILACQRRDRAIVWTLLKGN